MYRETLRVEERQQNDRPDAPSGKVNRICDAFLEALYTRKVNVKNVITAQVCRSPPDLDAGLMEIVRLRGKPTNINLDSIPRLLQMANEVMLTQSKTRAVIRLMRL